MSEDLLDLGNLKNEPNKLPAPVNGDHVSSQGVNTFSSSSMSDLWTLASPATTSVTAIPRFTEIPPDNPSTSIFPSSTASVAHSTSSTGSNVSTPSKSTESTLSQLQDLWYPSDKEKTPSRHYSTSSSVSTPAPTTVIPPVMSPTPPPTENSERSTSSSSKSQERNSFSNSSPSLEAIKIEVTSQESPEDIKHSSSQESVPDAARKLTLSASMNPPPFQIWSPQPAAPAESHQSMPSSAGHTSNGLNVSRSADPSHSSHTSPSMPTTQAANPSPSTHQTKYSVTTVAAPPGTVDQETLLVMKDMVKTMSDMTKRMLNMEERISRLEMEKEQLSRTVNRLQEMQHQQMVRQEAPKPSYPITGPPNTTAPYPQGYPPGYSPNVTSTYAAVPPAYGRASQSYAPRH